MTRFALASVGILGAILCRAGGTMSIEQPGASGPFGSSSEVDTASGLEVYTLSYQDPARKRSVAARVVPAAGSNLISLVVDGTEVLHAPPTIAQSAGTRFGVPVLYPTPNRVRDSKFTFEGRTFEFTPNERTNFLHGLVHSAAWQADEPVVTHNGVRLRTWLDFDERFTAFARFPIKNRLTLTHALTGDGVTLAFEVENRDKGRLPFGFALHPYFKILGERPATFIKVPAQSHMQAEGLLPTGRLEPLEGSPLDIRQFTSLERLQLDDVYFGMAPGRPAGYECRDRGVRVTLEASDVFTHAVVYTPPGRPFFCIENQTCSTDAHNLHARDLVKESHLQVLEPGGRASGTVRIRVARM